MLHFVLYQLPKAYTAEKLTVITLFCYGQAYYALEMVGQMKKGESVLIHSGTGGVGQAAIHLCLHAGCTVYTTVGTKEKREFIKKQYPQVFGQSVLMFKMY
jgi:fatty acid synthase